VRLIFFKKIKVNYFLKVSIFTPEDKAFISIKIIAVVPLFVFQVVKLTRYICLGSLLSRAFNSS